MASFRALFFFLPLFLRVTSATPSNRTIDDEYGDSVTGQKPIFLPTAAGIWDGETCAGCRVQPDPKLAHNGTWNAATFRPEPGTGSGPISIDLSFKGTAIWLFFITANNVAGGIITTLTECNFTLDGEHAGYFRHEPTASTDMQYNVLGFNSTSLSNIDHTLRVSTGGVDYHVFVNFDYAIYTFDDDPDPTTTSSPPPLPGSTRATTGIPVPTSSSVTKSGPPVGVIVGGTIGGLAVLLGIVLLLCIYRLRRNRRKMSGLSLEMALPSHHKPPPTHSRNSDIGRVDIGMPFQLMASTKHRFSRSFDRTPYNGDIHPTVMHGGNVLASDYREMGFNREPQPSTHPLVPNHGYTSTSSGAADARRDVPPSLPLTADEIARRAQQAELERQLRAAERGLRDLGVEPRRGAPDRSITPAVLQTSVYIEYRRIQGEMEEPPPEYSQNYN